MLTDVMTWAGLWINLCPPPWPLYLPMSALICRSEDYCSNPGPLPPRIMVTWWPCRLSAALQDYHNYNIPMICMQNMNVLHPWHHGYFMRYLTVPVMQFDTWNPRTHFTNIHSWFWFYKNNAQLLFNSWFWIAAALCPLHDQFCRSWF